MPLIELFKEHFFNQWNREPTMVVNILDLIFAPEEDTIQNLNVSEGKW